MDVMDVVMGLRYLWAVSTPGCVLVHSVSLLHWILGISLHTLHVYFSTIIYYMYVFIILCHTVDMHPVSFLFILNNNVMKILISICFGETMPEEAKLLVPGWVRGSVYSCVCSLCLSVSPVTFSFWQTSELSNII